VSTAECFARQISIAGLRWRCFELDKYSATAVERHCFLGRNDWNAMIATAV